MKLKAFFILCSVFVFNTTALALPDSFYAFIMPGNIQFQMTDPLGNTSGYDPASQMILQNIPDTIYALHYEAGEYDYPTNGNSHYTLGPNKYHSRGAIVGTYKLKIFAPNTVENFIFGFDVDYQNIPGGNQIATIYRAILYPNVVWTYEISIPDVPPATRNVPLIKVSNPQNLIIDINAAGQLGYIGSSEFVSEITKKINKIEEKRLKPPEKDNDNKLTPAQKAKKEYTELLGEITEKYTKPEADEFVKQEAYTVLKEDLEYIIGHL